jgi:hypothetical protein
MIRSAEVSEVLRSLDDGVGARVGIRPIGFAGHACAVLGEQAEDLAECEDREIRSADIHEVTRISLVREDGTDAAEQKTGAQIDRHLAIVEHFLRGESAENRAGERLLTRLAKRIDERFDVMRAVVTRGAINDVACAPTRHLVGESTNEALFFVLRNVRARDGVEHDHAIH